MVFFISLSLDLNFDHETKKGFCCVLKIDGQKYKLVKQICF